jgi:hypothetical protein
MSPGSMVAESVHELWLDYVTRDLHSFENILRAHDRTKIVRPLQVSLELFRDQIMNHCSMFVLLSAIAIRADCLLRLSPDL